MPSGLLSFGYYSTHLTSADFSGSETGANWRRILLSRFLQDKTLNQLAHFASTNVWGSKTVLLFNHCQLLTAIFKGLEDFC